MLISPCPINNEKLTKNPLIPNSRIYPYQKAYNDNRWIVKRSQANNFQDLILHLKKIIQGSNHDHPVILSIHKFYLNVHEANPNEFIIYEKLPRMKRNLHNYRSQRSISQSDIITIAYDLICGVESLHNKSIPHCNVKPTNIFIDNFGRAKLSDINLQAIKQGENLLYMAPEIQRAEYVTDKRVLSKADMWSIGVILAELCLNQAGIMKEKGMEDKLQDLVEGFRGKYEDAFVDLLSFLTRKENHLRIPAKDARKYLEENYAGLCNYYPRKETILDRKNHSIKEELASRYEGIYEFQDKKPFSISTTDGNKSDNETIKELFQYLQTPVFNAELKHSYSFDFNASSSHLIDANAVNTISQYLDQHLHNLMNLNLNFTYCEKINDEAITKLCLGKSNFASLSELALQFRWCKKITDLGLHNLTYHIPKQWGTLRFLTLDFRNCPKITSEGIEKLSKNFQDQLQDLQSLKLMFSGCKEIDDKGIKSLYVLIGHGLPELRDLSLSFAECSKISVKTFKEFCQQLKQKSLKLTNLKLDFTGCNNLIDGLNLKELKSIRDDLTFLKLFELKFV